jgi:copper homeostasis protein
MKKQLLEVCIENIESILIAEKAGASRIEFCADLCEGGITPSLGIFRTARGLCTLPFNVMIRPRGGNFVYSDNEFKAMLEDVHIFKEEGADAIVFGILDTKGNIDIEKSQKIIDKAGNLPVTFHRAFDETVDGYKSLEQLIELGVDRVLTSGLAPSVIDGTNMLKELIKKSSNKIIIMPGCGIKKDNFIDIDKSLNAREYHGTFSKGSNYADFDCINFITKYLETK